MAMTAIVVPQEAVQELTGKLLFAIQDSWPDAEMMRQANETYPKRQPMNWEKRVEGILLASPTIFGSGLNLKQQLMIVHGAVISEADLVVISKKTESSGEAVFFKKNTTPLLSKVWKYRRVGKQLLTMVN
jgi:hypothetical protein